MGSKRKLMSWQDGQPKALRMLVRHLKPEVMQDIESECNRQYEKWGQQEHLDFVWALILGEENGEVQKAVLERLAQKKDASETRAELIQVAAVCISWLNCMDRRPK